MTAQDVLILINRINSHPGDSSLPAAPELPPPFYDVDGDGLCNAVDVLMVINLINKQSAAAAEGEPAVQAPKRAAAELPGYGEIRPSEVVLRSVDRPAEAAGAVLFDRLPLSPGWRTLASKYESDVDKLFSKAVGPRRGNPWEPAEVARSASERTRTATSLKLRSEKVTPIEFELESAIDDLLADVQKNGGATPNAIYL